MSERKERWFDYPKNIVAASEIGDYEVQNFLDNYIGGRLDQNMELFDRAFALLTERGHYSRKNAFGEMHCDSYMWIEKCEHSQVLVYEIQSARFLFVKENKYDETYGEERACFGKIHIRELYFEHAYPAWKKNQLKNAKLKHFRDADFKMRYGDSRDEGYIGTAEHAILRNYETSIKDATMRTASIIDMMCFWEVYLDNPDELE
ncbi:MAG: hypothetical protein KAS32_18295 [Candidatus Peribacteraceae bacterium]|nr:hypothetical protein [Candidatus Peribacteraceae bacterium]